MSKIKTYIYGCIVGLINALFGAGGGLIAVAAFKNMGLTQKQAQASAISVILPLSIISAVVYYCSGYYQLSDALRYIPFGVVGALIGSMLLKKIPDRILKKIFALFLIYTGVRMILR